MRRGEIARNPGSEERLRSRLQRVVAAICVSLLAACGGGGSPARYSVGASVFGLTGSGLVLQLNGGGDLAVTADSSVKFATPVASGASYTVTVKTQPSSPPQTCTVANGSGTVGSADVTSVAINCVTTAYAVGVNVSGLSGSGLVLQLNGRVTLPIIANGDAAFSLPLDSGATYAVAVMTQPTLPAQNCLVANGSGTIGTANLVVMVTCGPGCSIASSGGGTPVAAATAYAVISSNTATGGVASTVMGYPTDPGGPACPTVSITSPNDTDAWTGVARDSSGYLYVGSDTVGTPSLGKVLVFAPTVTGMATPARTIGMPGAIGPIGLDGAGNLYVATNSAILEFAAGASGDAAPIRSINSAGVCEVLAIDGNGNIVCADLEAGVISVFTSGQSGNATPVRKINLGGPMKGEIIGVSLDPSGNIYVATSPERNSTSYPVSILEFAAGADSTGTETPIRNISGDALPGNNTVSGIGFDAAGNLYVLEANCYPSSLLRFAAQGSGFAAPTSKILFSLPNAAGLEIRSFDFTVLPP